MKSYSESYKAAGVDITAGYRAVELMKSHVASTMTEGALSGIGGFGGLFVPPIAGMKEPVLVSGTDGVGTKLKLAFLADRHDTVGIDCVAMCVNDIICAGAAPMFFLDYIALGKNVPEKVADIVSGVAEGCRQARCALIGGETAEMPGFYPEDEYDLAGFSVGIVDRAQIVDNSKMRAGDVLIALPSSGVHSNGFSLVHKVFHTSEKNIFAEVSPDLGMSVGDALLTPTKIYVKAVLELLPKVEVCGISHITGGGFYENIPRSIPDGLGAVIDRGAKVYRAIIGVNTVVGKNAVVGEDYGGFTPEQLPPVTVVGSECAVPDGETVAPGQMVGNDVYPKIDKNEKEGSAL